ncbi:MAG: TRAP transporter substrate-binding protein [Planctomycetota bacterium]|jgi:TRAP-type C4-dicarboxylate transport system substrate-binding protein
MTARPAKTMRRIPVLVFLAAVLCLPTAASAKKLKVATIVPDGSSWMVGVREAAAEIEEKTEGRVQFKFYPGGVMGSDETVLRKIRAGQLQGGAFTSGALARIYPDIDLYGIPLQFRSYEEVDYVRKRMDADMIAGLESAGFVALSISDGGFAYLMSQKPVRSVGDMEGTRVWIQEGDVMSQTAFDIAGISPIQLPLADVYTGLQTRLIDTIAAPPMGAIALQWHTKVKYATDVPLTYLIGVFVIEARAFGKLRPDDQKIVREVVREAARSQDLEDRKSDENAKQALRDQGIEFVTSATPEEEQRWHDIRDQALVVLREKQIYTPAMIDEIERHLEEYRSSSRADGGG